MPRKSISSASDVRARLLNRSLHAAKSAKQDEFYAQYVDIQKEVEACLEYAPDTFRNKIVYCDCDDSNPRAAGGVGERGNR